jgi:polyferredoxin
VVGTVLGVIFLGKNVYCYRICPFHGIEYLLQKISGMKLNPSRALLKRTRTAVNFLLWLSLMVIFLSKHPALGSFEPFAMMFSLNGTGIQWFILPLALIGSFFMSTFWCRFFCPCGQALTKMVQFRKSSGSSSKQKSDRSSGSSGKYLANLLYLATFLFVLGFIWQSIASFIMP